MSTFLNLSVLAAIPVLVSIALYLFEKKTAFGKLNGKTKQIIIGLIFGAAAVFSTEFGVDVGGATANIRDAAVLSAGLIFGAPAGIIAGFIGGIERWFAVYWGAGEYTRLACTVSTILAGFIGAVLRKYMFDNKKPSAIYALGIGLVTEVIHMLMIFFTNMSEVAQAFSFVEKCSFPMITLNGVAVMLSVLAVSIIGKEKDNKPGGQKQISTEFQRWLLVCVLAAFIITSSFTLVLQDKIAENSENYLLSLNIKDVKDDITDDSDKNLINLTKTVANELKTETDLNKIAAENGIAEVNIVNENGIITASTNASFVGYNMADGEQSAEFLVLLNGEKEFAQSYRPISFDSSLSRKYAGVTLENGGFVQVGYDAEQFQKDIDSEVLGITRNRHITQNGCVIIADKNWNIVSDRNNNEGSNLDVTGIWIDTSATAQNTKFSCEVYGEPSFCMYVQSEGYYIIGVMPETEAVFTRNLSVYVTVFMEIVVFVGIFILIYFLIKKLVVNNIRKVNESLSEITGGNLDVTVNVRSNEEFASLSDDINSTVVTLKQYISEAAARIDKELEFARSIQHSALPSVFPPYPNRKDFDVFARMDTAKEVGGDFYDFYLTSHNELVFLIADVSGKGIPAAMFMMRAKAQIKSFAETGMDVDEVFTKANEKLCENNDTEMFVTAWIGKINLETGMVSFANAGHNPPLVKHADGSFEYLKSHAGFVLAGMEGMKYKKNEIELTPGDIIYLYTDGVTEATDCDGKLYGEERLQNCLNLDAKESCKSICDDVKADVDRFVGDEAQFDDITMLCLKYFGGNQP